MLFAITRFFLLAFGVLSIVGGAMGYKKAGSRASLIAGGVAGVLLLVAGAFMYAHPRFGEVLGLVMSLLLAGRFFPRFLKDRKLMPSGLMGILGLIGTVLTLLLLLGFR